jgi:hypothetical protein
MWMRKLLIPLIAATGLLFGLFEAGLPALAYAVRLNTEGNNPPNRRRLGPDIADSQHILPFMSQPYRQDTDCIMYLLPIRSFESGRIQ